MYLPLANVLINIIIIFHYKHSRQINPTFPLNEETHLNTTSLAVIIVFYDTTNQTSLEKEW